MEEFFQQLTNGLAVGSIYALIALGYTMVYGVLKLINFAHGDLFTIGAYLGMTLLASFALHETIGPFIGLVVLALMVMGLVAILGAIVERTAYRPLRESPRLSAVVSALGASIFLQNAVMLIYGARFQVYPEDLIPETAVDLFGLYIPWCGSSSSSRRLSSWPRSTPSSRKRGSGRPSGPPPSTRTRQGSWASTSTG